MLSYRGEMSSMYEDVQLFFGCRIVDQAFPPAATKASARIIRKLPSPACIDARLPTIVPRIYHCSSYPRWAQLIVPINACPIQPIRVMGTIYATCIPGIRYPGCGGWTGIDQHYQYRRHQRNTANAGAPGYYSQKQTCRHVNRIRRS
jgi:hypothetical protein